MAAKQREDELRKKNLNLEKIVLERTLELHKLNAVLEIENVERQAAEASLQQINAELETRVFERTRELQEMNAALEEEVSERQAAEDGGKTLDEVITETTREQAGRIGYVFGK